MRHLPIGLFVLLFAALAQATPVLCQEKLNPWNFQAEDLPEAAEKAFIAAIRKGDPLPKKILDPKGQEPDDATRQVWLGNAPEVRSTMDEVTLLFEPKEKEQKPPPSNPDDVRAPFGVRITFEDEKLIVRHTEPRYQKQAGGLIVPHKFKKNREIFLDGKGRSGVIIFVPKIESVSPRGVMLCPRFIAEKLPYSAQIQLQDDPYILTGAKFTFNGHLAGRVLSGGGAGFAQAKILTTPSLPKGFPYKDETFARDPKVEVNYVPVEGFETPRYENPKTITAGLKFELDLQSSTGYKRFSTQTSLAWIKRIDIDAPFVMKLGSSFLLGTPFAIFLPERAMNPRIDIGIDAHVQPGPCYLVVADSGKMVHTYSREGTMGNLRIQ